MTILFASTDYVEPGQSSTGLPNYLKRISNVLAKAGHNPIIVYSAIYNQHRFEGNVEIYAVRVPFGNMDNCDIAEGERKRCLMRGYYINQKINEISQKKKIDVIQFTSLQGIALFYSGIVPATIRLSSYTKCAYSKDNNTLSSAQIENYSKLELDSAKHIGNVFGPSDLTAKIFEKDYGKHVEVIESPFYPIKELDNSVYNNFIKDKEYALFFGKMYAEKGVLDIANILEKYLELFPAMNCVFIGSDTTINGESAYSIIRRKAGKYSNRVYIISELIHPQLFAVVKHAKFVVMPSYMENFSNACMEAMYYNGCVIATRNAGFEQLIDEGQSGFLVEVGNCNELLETMSRVTTLSDIERDGIRDKAQARIEQNTSSFIVNQLINHYEIVINNAEEHAYKVSEDLIEEIKPYLNNESLYKKLISDADKRYLNSRAEARWIHYLLNGTNPIEAYLKRNNITEIAVYGMLELGRLVVDSLENTGISVAYIMDRDTSMQYKDFTFYQPNSSIPDVQLIIVTPIIYYEEIEGMLKTITDSKIVSIEELLL